MIIRQLLIDLGSLFFYKKLESEFYGMNSVLDLGCGGNSPLAKFKKRFFSVGVDVFAPSIEESKKRKIHDEYRITDVLEIDRFFKRKSFDAVVALDLIEHFEKKEGLTLLKKMEVIAKKKIIVLTPNGFTKQDPYEDNPYQTHKSGWEVEEFRKLGYRAYGMRGLRWIRGECATIKYKPWFFWGAVSTISELFLYYFPDLSYQLFIVKKL